MKKNWTATILLLLLFSTLQITLFERFVTLDSEHPGQQGRSMAGTLSFPAGDAGDFGLLRRSREALESRGFVLEAVDDHYRAEVNVPLKVLAPGILENDQIPVGASAVATLVEPPRNGRLELKPDGSFIYTAGEDFAGTDRFTYRLQDGFRQTNTAEVRITVPEIAPAPATSTLSVEPLAFTAPQISATTDFSETVDGTVLSWEKAYFQDLDIVGITPLEIPFGVNLPPAYDPSDTVLYPLVLYLHGAGARRDWTASSSDPDLRDHTLVDAALQRDTARFFARASQTDPLYGAFVFTPQVPSTSHLWVGTGPDIPYLQTDDPGNTYSEYMHLLINLLGFLHDGANAAALESVLGLDAGDIDTTRIYVVGDSDGAKGTWDILGRLPSDFAGAVAACGTGPRNRLEELSRTPLWTIHGKLDDVVINALPSPELPYGSGTLGMLALLDPGFDNTASPETVYLDDRRRSEDDPYPSDALIYTEFEETINHSGVAVYWTGNTSGVLPWLFGQAGSPNAPPTAEDQTVSTVEDTPVAITLKAVDPEGDPLTYAIVSPPSSGTLSGTPPDVTYTPEAGFTGTDTFTFQADDGSAASNTATVTVEVAALALVQVPQVEGLALAEAEAQIQTAGLVVGRVDSEYNATVPADAVIRQYPAAGVLVAEGSPVDLAASLGVDGPAVLKGPYLVLPEGVGGMTLLWQTDRTPAEASVEWWQEGAAALASGPLTETGSGVDEHQFSWTLADLSPGTRYHYRILMDGASIGGSFRTAPADTATGALFYAYGDTRPAEGELPLDHDRVAGAINRDIDALASGPSMLLHLGDLVYDGNLEESWNREYFNRSLHEAYSLISRMPVMVARGNHDGSSGLLGKYWPHSYPAPGAYYHSFDYGPLHVSVVDQYTDYSQGSPQYTWLENDLKNTSKAWKMVLLHEPPYSAGRENLVTREVLVPLFQNYGVDLVLAGHNHYYARSTVGGLQYITSGGGGAPLYLPDSDHPYVVAAESSHHFLRLEISGDEMRIAALRTDGTAIEEVVLTRDSAPLAFDDAYRTPVDTLLEVDAARGVLANDVSGDGSALTAVAVDPPAHGTLTLNPDGSFLYAPVSGYSGTDTFTYAANDGTTTSNIAAVDITVEDQTLLFSDDFARPDAASLGNGWSEEEAAGAVVEIRGEKLAFPDTSDQVNRPMAWHGFSRVASGKLLWEFDFDWTRTGSEGTYRLFMQLGDGGLMNPSSQSDGVGINLIWTKLGDTHEMLGYRKGGTDTPLAHLSGTGRVRVEADLDTRTYAVSIDGTAVAAGIPFDGAVDLDTVRFFTDALNEIPFSGRSFDNVQIARPASSPGNTAPAAADDSYGVDEDAVLSVEAPGVLANDTDADGDPLSAELLTGPDSGALSLAADGGFVYTPRENFWGTDRFTYRAFDGTDGSAQATVSIEVRPLNDPPVAVDDAFGVAADSADNLLDVLANDTDADLDPLIITEAGPGDQGGAVSIDGGTVLLYTPPAGFSGQETFPYTVVDSKGVSASALVAVTVSSETVLFRDDFDRPDSLVVGNGWAEEEDNSTSVEVGAGRLAFASLSRQASLPMVTHGFARQSVGVLVWEFDFDWTQTGNDPSYFLFMQLGDGSLMSASDQDAGVGVNLIWTEIGGVDSRLGYRTGGAQTPLGILNGRARIRVEADLSAGTYRVAVDGATLASGIPFDHRVDLDTVRFFTDAMNENKYSGRSFDSVVLRAQPGS